LRNRFFLILFLCAMPFLGGVGCINDPASEVTEATFKTDAERIAFLQNFCPVSIPGSAKNIQLKYVSWLDYSLDASFLLPQDAYNLFETGLNASCQGKKRDDHFDFVMDKDVAGNVTLDSKTLAVQLHAHNSPPK